MREYLGLIFAYLGDGEPPAFPLLPEFDHPEYVIKHEVSLWPCNYFTQLDNSMDQAHTAIVHWQFQRGVPTVSAEETEGGAVVNVVGPGYRNPSYFMMPNAHEWGSPPRLGGKNKWSYARGWRVPVDDEHHCRFGIDVVPMTGEEADRYRQQQAERWARATRPWMDVAEDVIAGRMSPRDLKPEDYPDLVNIQDYIAQVALGPIARQPFPERLGRSDAAVSLVRKIWERELTALAAGRPLTKWRRPDTLWTEISASGGDLQ
ncbi:MAG: pobA 2 [Chloroflexi bacterium]|nr:pobA 2 [Chloroflexota bacterium]